MRRTTSNRLRALAVCIALAMAAPPAVWAQARPTIMPADYGRWENLGAAGLSPDGAWLAYGVTRVNEENELRILRLADDSTRVIAWGADPAFSANSGWLAYEIGVSTDERERLEENDEPVRVDVGLLDLARDGGERKFEDVRAFAFDAEGRFLALHGYTPEEADVEGDVERDVEGADLRVVDLGTGTLTTFGNVSEFSWSDSGALLAVAVTTGAGTGNSVQVYDAATGRLRSLEASRSTYRHLAWREDAPDLVALRSRETTAETEEAAIDEEGGPPADSAANDTEDEDADENPAHDVVAWRGLDGETPRTFVLGAGVAGMDGTLDIVEYAAPAWSDDGTMISIGLRPIETEDEEDEAEPVVAPTSSSDDEPETEEDESKNDIDDDGEEPELPGVQIWHSSDVRLFPQQKAAESADTRRTLLAVWHLDDERVVRIGTDLFGEATLLEGWRHALEELNAPYPWGTMFGRPYRDVWVVDVETGERELRLERVRYAWPSEAGRWIIAFDGENYASHDLETGASHDLTSNLDAVFADTTYDTPTDLLPPHGFGPGGWLEGDTAVLVYDQYDVWKLVPDGSAATRLTDGTAQRIVHRVVTPADDDTPGLGPDQPVYLSLHGDWSEQRGYARSMPDGSLETLVLEDRNISGLMKADSTDVYAYRRMAFDEPPSLFVAGSDLTDALQVTDTNPFFDEYAWGRAELIDFTSESGRPLQAVLYLPANYQGGTPVPTIVYTYEMRSPSIHTFRAPSERDYYNFTAWTQQGYAVLQPDIVYRARDPGISALESVRAAVARVVEMGVTDPDAVGLIGHSWGGYQATFLPTRTDIFAASVAGAPLTDFVSFMGAIHWNPGIAEVDHWETGQARMEVPFWEDPEAHRRNSPIHQVHRLETPILMAFGDDDGVVDWDQGTEFYNFARRAGKQMVLLVYEGEDHGFRQEPNQVDYHRRILEWFGHYLKGEPAAAWITEGVEFDELEAEKKRVATKRDG